jgi:dihydroorotate dehydrogenase
LPALQDSYRLSMLPLLFNRLNLDPEDLQVQMLQQLAWLCRSPKSRPYWAEPLRRFAQTSLDNSFCFASTRLQQVIWDLPFANPVGLAAGFDKNGIALSAWPHLGFGFAELGTVSWHKQPGNPRPRLFRLPKDLAALNRMGFNNRGALAMKAQLAQLLPTSEYPISVGVNIGKSKITPLANAHEDYLKSFQVLADFGNYFVINVSSPNTPGLRDLQSKTQLAPIFDALQTANVAQKPLLVKIAPDLAWAEIDDILELVAHYQLAGIIATNTTLDRGALSTRVLPQTGNPIEQEAGGISGAPVRQRSTAIIRYIYQQTQGKLPIIGVGGIFSAQDAWDKITAGASLVQVYTGWIYEGPWLVKQILQGLITKLDDAGLATIDQAVGLANLLK